jgi:hypothetical protein
VQLFDMAHFFANAAASRKEAYTLAVMNGYYRRSAAKAHLYSSVARLSRDQRCSLEPMAWYGAAQDVPLVLAWTITESAWLISLNMLEMCSRVTAVSVRSHRLAAVETRKARARASGVSRSVTQSYRFFYPNLGPIQQAFRRSWHTRS